MIVSTVIFYRFVPVPFVFDCDRVILKNYFQSRQQYPEYVSICGRNRNEKFKVVVENVRLSHIVREDSERGRFRARAYLSIYDRVRIESYQLLVIRDVE